MRRCIDPVLPQQRHRDDVPVARAPVVVLDFHASPDRRVEGLDEPASKALHDTPDERFGRRLDNAETAVTAGAPATLSAGRKLDAVAGTDIRSGRQFVTGTFHHELAEGLYDLDDLRFVEERVASVGRAPDFAQVFESPQQAPQPMRLGPLGDTQVLHQVVPPGSVVGFQGVTDIARRQLSLPGGPSAPAASQIDISSRR